VSFSRISFNDFGDIRFFYAAIDLCFVVSKFDFVDFYSFYFKTVGTRTLPAEKTCLDTRVPP